MERGPAPPSPRRRLGLFFRLFGVGALIALTSVIATTWVTVNSTADSLRDQQRRSLHEEALVYDSLVGYAATHSDWAHGQGPLDELARSSGYTLTLTDPDGVPLLSTDTDGSAAVMRRDPSAALIAVDALRVDRALLADATGTSTPTALTPASTPAPCGATGCRAYEIAGDGAIDRRVLGPHADVDTSTRDHRVSVRLRGAVDTCLERRSLAPVVALTETFGAIVDYREDHDQVRTCLDRARRAQLRDYVAPPALLFIDTGENSVLGWDPDASGWARIGLTAGGVLLVTVALCGLLAAFVLRPLRQLADASRAAQQGDLSARVSINRRDEIGQVAEAFNAMAERRQRLDEERVRLTSDVSHELRTPLANISGWIEAAEDGVAETGPALLVHLRTEADQLHRLVEDLHELALADDGRLGLAPRYIVLHELLEQCVMSFAPRAGGRQLRLDPGVDPDVRVRADPVRIRQALANLVANAIRHTTENGSVVLGGDAHTIHVRDNGEGISPEDLPHVFERFRRTDPSRSRDTGGSGLGLAIVRHIVEAHGGRVEITSDPGVETVATITLP